MYQHIVILYNSQSGPYQPHVDVHHFKELLESAFNCHVRLLEACDHKDISQCVSNECNQGADLVIGCGGDGTINAAVNGIMLSRLGVRLAILPLGTVNDFGTELGMTSSMKRLIDCLRLQTFKAIDLGLCNGRYFINVFAAGELAETGYVVPQGLKKVFGRFAYYLYGGGRLFRALRNTHRFTMVFDDESPVESDYVMLVVANSSSVGGFKNGAFGALPEDGELNCMTISPMKMGDALLSIREYFRSGELLGPGVHYRAFKTLKLDCRDGEAYDLDGERGAGFPVRIIVVPKAIEVLYAPEDF